MLSVSPIYGGLLALLTLWLAMRVSLVRREKKVSVGDAGDPVLLKAIRVHANSIEYIPVGILLLVLLEAQGTLPWQIHLLGGAFLLGRLMHAYGLGVTPQVIFARAGGTFLSHVTIALMAIANIALAIL